MTARELPTLKSSAIANYIGQGWSALIGIAFLPLYLRVLGVEAYGLIGVFGVLQAWMSVIDLGLTPTLNREMARLRAGAHTGESIRDLLRSLEVVCGALTGTTILVLCVIAPWLTRHWLTVGDLASSTATDAIRIIAFVLATRFFEQVYRAALQGAHDQIWLNGTTALLATLRWGGAYVAITQGEPTVRAFFVWQGIVSVVSAVLLIHRTYLVLPPSRRRGQFDTGALREVYGFARGMFVGSLLAFILTQSDKLAVSKLLSLGEFGYYTLAAAISGVLVQLVVPLNSAILPRLTTDVALGRKAELRESYHSACEWMATIVVPPALVLALFPEFVLLAWSGDRSVAGNVAPLLRILVLGQLANALLNVPYMLQLAYGWTNLIVRLNALAVLLFVPLVLWAVPRYGGLGAAAAWLALNVGCLMVVATRMHRRLMPHAAIRWCRDAVAVPLLAGSAAALALRLGVPNELSRAGAGFVTIGAGLVILLSTGIAVPAVRNWTAETIRTVRSLPR